MDLGYKAGYIHTNIFKGVVNVKEYNILLFHIDINKSVFIKKSI